MPRLAGFVGGTFTNLSLPADAQTTINLYPELLESGTGKSRAVLHAVPGKRLWATCDDQPIRASLAQDSRAFVVAGAAFEELQANGIPSAGGTVRANDNMAAIASNGTGGNQLLIVSGGLVYTYNLLTNVFAQVASFPAANAVTCQFLDGYFLVLAGGAVYASNLEDGSTWNALSVGRRSIASDNLVSIIVDDHRILWFIGSKTSEPWTDIAATPFPFSPQAGAFMGFGCVSPFGIARFDNSLIWVGQTEAGGRVAYVLAGGYNAQRISNHGLEAIWATYSQDDVNALVVSTYAENGHTFALFHFGTAATWAYDAATQQWHQRGLWNTGTSQYDPDRARTHMYAFGKHLVGARDSGILYEQAMTLYDDAGSPRVWERRSPHLGNDDNSWIFGASFELLLETGVGLITGQGSDPQVLLSWSNDQGKTFGNELTRSFGMQGDFGTRVIWERMGRFRDRVWRVRGSEPVKTTLIDAIFEGRSGR